MAYTPGNTGIKQHAAVYRSLEIQRVKKATEHLLGICGGLIADQTINASEIRYLETWLADHQEVTDEWPGSVIAHRLRLILDDGFITADECVDLLQTLSDISRTAFLDTGSPTAEGPALPLDDEPEIYFEDMAFCLTGRFVFGTRSACERAILNLDGVVADNITKTLDYLVIGTMIEPQWAHSTFGRKIQKAVQYRDDGHGICIVSEQQWNAALATASRK